MKFDVIGFGALNVDKLCHVNRIACGGEESFILGTSEAAGGSAANTVVGLARLGIKTGFIGKVASDREGQLLLNDFRKEGVNTDGIAVVKQGRSGNVTAFVDKTGERALYVHRSVNDTLTLKEIDLKYAECTQFLHLASMDERPFVAQRQLVEMLPQVKISIDPGEIYARKGIAKLAPILRRCYVFMPSEKELSMLTGKHFRKGAATILKHGTSIVAVKLGRKGCFVTDGKESHLIEPPDAKPIDKTGAGDAFCAGFLYGLIKEKDLYECSRLGNLVASRCIEKVGARAGLPKASDLKDL